MFGITREPVPAASMLRTYRGGAHPECWRSYGDCLSVTIDRVVSLDDFVFAYYTSPAFRIERLILRIIVRGNSTDAEARAVANGSGESFAIWRVGVRTRTQLLMRDQYEKTRSWFRVVPVDGGGTLLQFGSAVAAALENRAGSKSMGGGFRLMLGFHVMNSQALLHAAMVGVRKSSVEKTTQCS